MGSTRWLVSIALAASTVAMAGGQAWVKDCFE
jgi:hypothetical protein